MPDKAFLAFTLAALPLCARGDGKLRVQGLTAQIPQDQLRMISMCFFENHMYAPFLKGTQAFTDVGHLECQSRCQAMANCSYFSFWPEVQKCFLSGSDAIFGPVPKTSASQGAITGPKRCPRAPCMEMPSQDFPGATARDSVLAWPSHRVPQNLECWPKNWTAGTVDSCPHIKVVEDTDDGWPGKCEGLSEVMVPHNETCESFCRKKVTCSVFQIVQEHPPFGPRSCWHADRTSGWDCYEQSLDPSTPVPSSSKRFMRGSVRVLARLVDVQVQGLVHAFPETYFIKVADAAEACKFNCYSNIFCQYWQYHLDTGCWVEDPAHGQPMPFPPTLQSWSANSEQVRTLIAGEYIQHLCVTRAMLREVAQAALLGPNYSAALKVRSNWTLVAQDKSCSERTIKFLGVLLDSTNLTVCEQRIVADNECGGRQMFTDLSSCYCIRAGQECDIMPGLVGGKIYNHTQVERPLNGMDLRQKLREHPPNRTKIRQKMKAAGFVSTKPKASYAPQGQPRVSQVTVFLRGLRFQGIGATQKVILNGAYVSAISHAVGIPMSSVTDLTHFNGKVNILAGGTVNDTKVSCIVTAPSGVDINERLHQDRFVREMQAASRRVAPGAASGEIAVRAALPITLEQSTQAPKRFWKLQDNTRSDAAQDNARSDASQDRRRGGMPWWAMVFMLIVAGSVLAIGIHFFEGGQKPSGRRTRGQTLGDGSPMSSMASDEEMQPERQWYNRPQSSRRVSR